MTKSKSRASKAHYQAPMIERGKMPDMARIALYAGFDAVSYEAHRLFAQMGGDDKVRMRVRLKF
jgi:hypothetical protein